MRSATERHPANHPVGTRSARSLPLNEVSSLPKSLKIVFICAAVHPTSTVISRAESEPDIVCLQELKAEHEPILTRSSLPGNPEDSQARYIEAAVNGVLIASIYLPNGNPQPDPKFNYKLAWFERLITHAAEFIAAGLPVVLAGDCNVVPTVQDIYPTRSLDNNALIQPESRQAFARLLAQGWTDVLGLRA
jgi:exonuclease III